MATGHQHHVHCTFSCNIPASAQGHTFSHFNFHNCNYTIRVLGIKFHRLLDRNYRLATKRPPKLHQLLTGVGIDPRKYLIMIIVLCNILELNPHISRIMMTSSNGNISALLAICAGNSPVPGEFPTQRPVPRSFDVFLDLRLNKRLSKQPWGWWFESLSRPLWRHHNGYFLIHLREWNVTNFDCSQWLGVRFVMSHHWIRQ